jgi:dienelactone hydrolase
LYGEKQETNSIIMKNTSLPRRQFLKSSAMIGTLSLMPDYLSGFSSELSTAHTSLPLAEKSIIGAYGPWAAGLVGQPPSLSFRNKQWKSIDKWKKEALSKALELVAPPEIAKTPSCKTEKKYSYDGLDIEELTWQLPYGNKTEAILLKPKGAKGPLPAVLGLHDHGGNKYFGTRKITKTSDDQHPMMVPHQERYYGGRAWANELARQGYVVLVPDSFAFASRRVLFKDMSEIPGGHCATKGLSDDKPERQENIDAYNRWAGEHEHILSKSLFCAGTTWPGVFFSEDKVALDILADRKDVNPERLGCAGLSGGGLRSVYLGGLDTRIKCAISVGFMTTWADFLLNKAYTHTWMTYTPLLPKYLEFPEILSLRAPLPTMTLNNNQDQLFTLSEMQKADGILKQVFAKAGAPANYKGAFYDGLHKFDVAMQEEAFDWFDKWLKA